MTDQVQSPEAGAQPQEPTGEVENVTPESLGLPEGSEIPKEEQGQEEGQQPPQQKVVPLAALHEEREEKKRLRQQMKAMEERFSQLQTVVSQRLQPPQQPQQQEVQIPDINVDPVGHFRARNELLERQIQELRQPVQEMRQMSEQERQIQALTRHVTVQEHQFAQSNPDYQDALKHMQSITRQGIRALGYDDAQVEQLLQREYLGMAHRIASQGGNVAETIYELAKANGYAQKQAQPTEQEKLSALKKGTAAAKSLGGGGGVTNRLSLAALAQMPADEFAKTLGDEDAWRKLWS